MFRAVSLLTIFTSFAFAQSDPVRQATAATILTPLPVFRNGYLCSLPMPGGTILNLFTPDGKINTMPIGHRAAMSVAVDIDGTLAIGWAELPKIGIDIRDLEGNLIRSIDTGRYMPAHLSFGRDHSFWSFGWQRDANDPSHEDKQDYLTVRHYSIDGKQAGAFLPRSLFPRGLEPGGGGGSSQISVTSDRVGLDAFAGKVGWQREYVELDLSGNLTGRWTLDRYDRSFPGVVLTDDGEAYVGRSDSADRSYTVLKLDRAKSKWEPVDSPDVKRFGRLYGVDGDQLVFANWPDQVLHLSWFPQPGSPLSASKAHN